MKRAVVVVLIALILSSCAKVHKVDLASEEAVGELNEAVSGRVVRIEMADGYEIAAEKVVVAPGTTGYSYGVGARQSTEVTTNSIHSLGVPQELGVKKGAIGGLVLGAALGGISGVGYEDPAGFFSTGDMIAIRAISGALLGLVVGAIAGPHVGGEQVFELAGDE